MKTKFARLPLLILTAFAAVSLARAEEPPAGPPPAEHSARPDGKKRLEHRLQMLDEKLQLTAAQKDQIKAIWAQAEQQGKALRADASAAREDIRAKAGDVMKAAHAQVRGVLTPDQQKIFDTMKPEGRGHRGPRPEGEKPAGPPPPAQQ